MKIVVAVLDTMWGDRSGPAPRYFQINPNNHSGKRLYKLLDGKAHLLVTNACRRMVNHATKHGKPDPEWLEQNLEHLDADLVLVCGSIAKKTLKIVAESRLRCMGHENGIGRKFIHIPHPAARCWSKRRLREAQRAIGKALA
jgi:hypothetical protein